MGNSNDLCADSTLVGVFPLLGDDPLAGGDTNIRPIAMSPDGAYE